jgi:lipopolysaccharide transport system ATP-binding protein
LALDDVTFEVQEGELLGIIGPNGAGKSTLLKILSQVTAPTSGQIILKGRVGSLLEVGTGFHPDLTGRENIFLNGAVLGMTKAEIRKRFDEIVAFSDCASFIDTPVKRYSSGMYVRLAFAVAAHLESEILVVDEVLAVGDAQFQKKCLGKMGDVARVGRTILFVSHNMLAVQSLCRRAILFRGGRIVNDGPTDAVLREYFRETCHSRERREWPTPDAAPGNDTLRIKQIGIGSADENSDDLLTMNRAIQIDTEFWVLVPDLELHITYHLINEQGIIVLTTYSMPARRKAGLYRASFTLPANLLNSGFYSLNLLVVQNGSRVTYEHDALVSFAVADAAEGERACMGREPGVVQPVLTWRIDPVSAAECA